MKKSTKVMLGLTAVCAGVATYVYIKNKETSPVETFSEDFYDEVSDGQLSFSDEELYNKDTDKNE